MSGGIISSRRWGICCGVRGCRYRGRRVAVSLSAFSTDGQSVFPGQFALTMRSWRLVAKAGREKSRQQDLWIALLLAIITFSVYAQVRQFEFVNYDDPDYVTENPHVRGGLSASGAAW